jgi:periplasmic copper chaperone A
MLRNLLLLTVLFAPPTQAAGLTIGSGWIREAPPGAQTLAGYAVLSNTGTSNVRITGAAAADFAAAQLHEMTMADGVMRMRELGQIEIATGASVELEPGGSHLMLLGPKRALHAGDTVRIEFLLDGSDPVFGDFVVRKMN